uniref:Secreted protein n=1 Tax=Drosophila melanogaster TaxID=7227 RepID=Q9VEL4_DROME|nr:uncharacterized protein Dmel_CG31419 [Drosophila melanogaster]AAF55407.3 uncharacterized protein Dmel_CG31419 [Drosophila melanogaster]|eukprot:NP_732225.2 uncharacterized protein Dmel_CG31419 [Drosophila melanogaster]
MQVHRFFCGLLIYLFLICSAFSQDETKVPPTETTASPAASVAAEEAPKSSNPEASGSSKCKSNEILSENGCVDRENFLNKIMFRSWQDEGFGKAKARAGLVDGIECRDGEVRTPFGCSTPPYPPHRESDRVPVHHSSLYREQVVHSNYGSARSVHQEKVKIEKGKRQPYLGPPISGHNIPRKNYILPGRLLRSDRQCRPYESPGKDGQCHPKKGKTGNYKHTNHVYGLQLRHRHEAQG